VVSLVELDSHLGCFAVSAEANQKHSIVCSTLFFLLPLLDVPYRSIRQHRAGRFAVGKEAHYESGGFDNNYEFTMHRVFLGSNADRHFG